jgi:ornithine cyclodeaminase/alanine dehydrogenase-like protein (mu-crystallin family)
MDSTTPSMGWLDVVINCQTKTMPISPKANSTTMGPFDFGCADVPQILLGEVQGRQHDDEVIISSPFGLGILDLAVSDLIYKLVLSENIGTRVPSFLPSYWLDRS